MDYLEFLNPIYWQLIHWQIISFAQMLLFLYVIFKKPKLNKAEEKKKLHTLKILKFLAAQLNELIKIWEESPKY